MFKYPIKCTNLFCNVFIQSFPGLNIDIATAYVFAAVLFPNVQKRTCPTHFEQCVWGYVHFAPLHNAGFVQYEVDKKSHYSALHREFGSV